MTDKSLEERIAALEQRMNVMQLHTLPVQPHRLGPQPVTKEQEEANRKRMRGIFEGAFDRLRKAPPVDRSKQELVSGKPVPEDRSHTEIKENGQQKDYIVLSAEERAKGFVRPVRRSYIHTVCGTDTRMSQQIAETYARDPKFYSGTFCCGCGKHFPLDQFVWKDNPDQQVGS